MKKRLASVLLVMAMLLSMAPPRAFAEETEGADLLIEPAATEELETVPETTGESIPELEEALLSEEELPVEEAADGLCADILIVPAEPVALRAGITDYDFGVGLIDGAPEVDIAYALDETALSVPGITLTEGKLTIDADTFKIPDETCFDFSVTVTATARGQTEPMDTKTISVKAYAALSGIKLVVGGACVSEWTINTADGADKSVTVTAAATDDGPLGQVTWSLTDESSALTNLVYGDVSCAFTATGKLGTAELRASFGEFTAQMTIRTVFAAPTAFKINDLSTPAGVNVIRAGTKAKLTTDLNKKLPAGERTVSWSVAPAGAGLTEDQIAMDGMALGGEQFASYVRIDKNKGVLTVSANIPAVMQAVVTATLPNGASASLPIQLQPAVSSKAAAYTVNGDNTVTVTPTAPGRLTYTATAKDGSKVSVSGTVNIVAQVNAFEITSDFAEGLTAGDKPVALTAKAYYDSDRKLEIAKPKINWDLRELEDITDEDWFRELPENEKGRYFHDQGRFYNTWPTKAAAIKSGKLVLGKVPRNTKLLLSAYTEIGDSVNSDYTVFDVKAGENASTLVLAMRHGEEGSYSYAVFDPERMGFAPDAQPAMVACWMDGTGKLNPVTEKVTYKATNADYRDDILTIRKPGKVTLKATVGKVSTAISFDSYFWSKYVEITNENPVVISGKTLKMRAVSWFEKTGVLDGLKDTPATHQKFTWFLTGENTACAAINAKSGVLTAKDVETVTTLTVGVRDNDGLEATGTVTINPRDKVYVTVKTCGESDEVTGYEAVPASIPVNKLADKTFPVSNLSVDVRKNTAVEHLNVTNVRVSGGAAKAVTLVNGEKAIQLSGKPGTLNATVYARDAEGRDVSAKVSVKLVNAVTDITINEPTAAVVVGKAVKLTAQVNKGTVKPTNGRLIWGVSNSRNSEAPAEGADIQDGVLKASKAGKYYVWAKAADGYGRKATPVEVKVCDLAASVIVEAKNDLDGERFIVNDQTLTMDVSETAAFTAEMTNAKNIAADCSQDVKWSVSGNKNYVDVRIERGKLTLTGKKKGTVTVTAAATDGSKRGASFKVAVNEKVTEYAAVVNGKGCKDAAELQKALDESKMPLNTVTLWKDITLEMPIYTKKNTNLDLNGHTIHCESDSAIIVTQTSLTLNGTGTVSSNVKAETGKSAIAVGSALPTAKTAATVNVGEDVTVSCETAIRAAGNAQENLNIKGRVIGSVATGRDEKKPAKIKVYPTAEITNKNGVGIYLPSGTLNVEGGTITGTTAIYVQSGTANITGGTIHGTGRAAAYVHKDDGCAATGDALAVESCGYPVPTVNISGGTFSSDHAAPVGIYRTENAKPAVVNFVSYTIPGYAYTAGQLAAALTSGEKAVDVTLGTDIELMWEGKETDGRLGGANTKTISINLGGKKLTLSRCQSGLGAVNPKAVMTVKNGTMTSIGSDGDAGEIRFRDCGLHLTGVAFEKPVAIDNAGKKTGISNCSISDPDCPVSGPMLRLSAGTNVTADRLTILARNEKAPAVTNSAIRISDENVCGNHTAAPADTTLTISNAAVASDAKAAVMVASCGKTRIVWSVGNDISGVAADTVNAVWNDADYAAYYRNITVKGCKLAQEAD